MPEIAAGKTVQMIATMAKNLPGIDDEYKTTLIVVPAALLQQVSNRKAYIFLRFFNTVTSLSGRTRLRVRLIASSLSISTTGRIN